MHIQVRHRSELLPSCTHADQLKVIEWVPAWPSEDPTFNCCHLVKGLRWKVLWKLCLMGPWRATDRLNWQYWPWWTVLQASFYSHPNEEAVKSHINGYLFGIRFHFCMSFAMAWSSVQQDRLRIDYRQTNATALNRAGCSPGTTSLE